MNRITCLMTLDVETTRYYVMSGHLRVRQHIDLHVPVECPEIPGGGGKGVYNFLASRNECKYA